MKYTNKEVVNIINIFDSNATKKLPQKISYAIMKNSIIFRREYEIYEKALTKIYNDYKDKFYLDKNGNPILDKRGLPIVHDDAKDNFEHELVELLKIEVDIDPYFIPESCFEYDDTKGNYDALTPADNFSLIELLCQKAKTEKGETK